MTPDEADEENSDPVINDTEDSSTLSEINVHIVTEEDIIASKYKIQDIILPLIGKNVMLPSHGTGDYINTLLHERGLFLDTLNRTEKGGGVKSRIRGHYRRVVEFPADFSYKLVQYSNPNDTIQQTEINSLNLQPQLEGKDESESLPSAQHRQALVVEFNLSPGSYATMVLRELMKEATDASYHAEMTASTTNTVRGDMNPVELESTTASEELPSRKRTREENIS